MNKQKKVKASDVRRVLANGKAAEESRAQQAATIDDIMARYPDMPLAQALAMEESRTA